MRINCDLHSWMVGWVVVAAHPYYAITGADGQFAFDNLPPGQYKLQIWHERLGTHAGERHRRRQAAGARDRRDEGALTGAGLRA